MPCRRSVTLQPGDDGVKACVALTLVGPAMAIASDCAEGETKAGCLRACFGFFGTIIRKTALPVRSLAGDGDEPGNEPPPQPAANETLQKSARARESRMAPTYGRIASATGWTRPLVNVANGAPV